MRKIDDTKLLEMHKAGTPQKDIAAFFQVSPAAICKRLRRLLPKPVSLEALTEKEQRFCQEIAKGKTQTQAALASFDVSSRESAKVIGSALMSKEEIRRAVQELLERHLPRERRIKRLADLANHADPGAALKALDIGFKLGEDYPEKGANIENNIALLHVDLSEYQARKPIPVNQDEK